MNSFCAPDVEDLCFLCLTCTSSDCRLPSLSFLLFLCFFFFDNGCSVQDNNVLSDCSLILACRKYSKIIPYESSIHK